LINRRNVSASHFAGQANEMQHREEETPNPENPKIELFLKPVVPSTYARFKNLDAHSVKK
jgi:hypothetical protein